MNHNKQMQPIYLTILLCLAIGKSDIGFENGDLRV